MLKISIAFLVLLFCTSPAATSKADVIHYVKKYKNVTISHKALLKLNQYNDLIDYFTRYSYFVPNHKVSKHFIKALILAESGADHKAVSKKNARGLGQIMYPTAKEAAEELAKSRVHFKYVSKEKLRNIKEEDLFDPAINILLTCYLIAKYNYKFNGKIELVLSAWNAGEYTESLVTNKPAPYSETQNLIGKVNGYYLYLLKHRY